MRLRCAALAAFACALAAAATSGAATRPQLTPAGNADFPDRAFVLTTPKPISLDDEKVVIRENGARVGELAVIPAGEAASRTFATMLVLDASNSMKGEAIAKAVAAARAFAARRPGSQGLGVVTFNRRVNVVLEPTTDPDQIRQALATRPRLEEETHLYDAASAAIDVLQEQGVSVATVVLLTDGNDTGSAITPDQLAAKARAAGVRLFAVGLRSPQFRPERLKALAEKSGGTFIEAKSAAALGSVYRSLSKRLANEYLLRYRSPAGPKLDVVVEVKAAGVPGVARSTYTTPAIPVTPLPPFHRSTLDRFLESPLSGLALAIFVGLVVALTLRAILRRRDRTVRRRVGQFVQPARAEATSGGSNVPGQGGFVARQFVSIDRSLGRLTWWERLKEDIEIGEYPVQAVPLVLGTIALTILAAFVLGTAFLPLYALFALAVPFVVRGSVKKRLSQRRQKFAEQLPDNLLVMAASLRAGHSFVGALNAVVEEADEPARSELRRAVADEQLGVPMESALLSVAERMKNGDLEQVALVASLQRETGGNTAAVLDTVVDTVRERFELRRMVMTLTAQGRMTRWILVGLPVAVGVVASLLNPYYMKPLFNTAAGQVMLAVVIAMMIVGSFMIKKILEIEL
jgi:tight adherence protein B